MEQKPPNPTSRMEHLEADVLFIKDSQQSLRTEVKEWVVGVRSDINELKVAISKAGRPSAVLVLSVIGVALTFFTILMAGIPGVFMLLSAKVETESIRSASQQELASIKSQMTTMEQIRPVMLAAESSRADRDALNRRVDTNGTTLSVIQARADALEAFIREKFGLLETQDKAITNMLNSNKAEYYKWIGIMYEKVYGQKMPETEFYPSIHVSSP